MFKSAWCEWRRTLTAFGLLGVTAVLRASPFGSQPEWSVDFKGGTIGQPVHFGGAEGARGLLIAEHNGAITLVSAQGAKQWTINLDAPVETQAVAADLQKSGRLSIIAVDARGSIYCFNEAGQRLWKFMRCESSGDNRIPVVADLDGDGRKEILISDSRGHLDILNADGKLRLEITATKYRVGVPAVGDVNGDDKSEIIFGTEAGEIYCVGVRGRLLWSTTLDGCFGRALPLIADADGDGNYEVYFPTAFSNAHPGLFALAAATGAPLWKAPSIMQSYRSTVVADLDGDGQPEILFGDKNSSLFCLDSKGHRHWSRQLDGRGIFFAPTVADLQGKGKATIFAVVRDAGQNGKSLYALDNTGQLTDALALPGGGGTSPVLCRFQGQPEIRLAVLSGSGRLSCYRLEQKTGASRILWAGVRNDAENTGFIKSTKKVVRKVEPDEVPVTTRKRAAFGGTNKLVLSRASPDADLLSVETVLPDHSRRMDLLNIEQGTKTIEASFVTSVPGDYEITVRWHTRPDRTVQKERYSYHLDRNYKTDVERLREVDSEVRAMSRAVPMLAGLRERELEMLRAKLEIARKSGVARDFDLFHWSCDYLTSLARYIRQHEFSDGIMVHQLENPWSEFDAAAFFKAPSCPPNSIFLRLLGNAYESAAIALTNLRPYPATVRLVCGAFQSGKEVIEGKQILEFRDVLKVRPQGTGEQVEDALPLLGDSQTVRLEPGETRKVWMTFHSRSLQAGKWSATLKAGEIAVPEDPIEVPATIEVSSVRLPERFTYRECNWLYLDGIRDPGLQEATLRDAVEHGMNVFCIPGVSIQVNEQGVLGQADTIVHDNLVRKLGERAFFLVSGPISVQWPTEAKPDAAMREKSFADAFRWYGDHMRSLGIDYKDYAIYVQDEPGLMGHDANFETFVARVKQFKAAEPRIQIYANPAGGARAELLRPLQDLIDVWAPDVHLVREQPEELPQIFRRGKQYWHYEAPADQRTLDPLGFYRLKPWVAFQMGMTGGGYWVYESADYWFTDPNSGTEYGSVYPTALGPVTTKRWEASREGIQDFELLWLLRNTASRAVSPTGEQASKLLNEAVTFVTRGQEKVTDISRHVRPYTPNYQKWMDFRSQLIQMQEQLARAGK